MCGVVLLLLWAHIIALACVGIHPMVYLLHSSKYAGHCRDSGAEALMTEVDLAP